MSSKEILVIGSLHYDIFVESPNLPKIGETVRGNNWYPKLGGKGGNQAISASLNSVSVKLVSAVGKDSFAIYILENLEKMNINTKYIQRLNNHNSGISVAISNSDGDYGATIVSGSNLNINTDIFKDQSLWNNVEILMLQNEIDENTNIYAAKKAKELGIKVFYNAAPAKKINFDLFDLVDILLVNTIEAQDITGSKIQNLEDIKKVSKILSRKIPIAIVSAGEDGVVICKTNNEPIHFKGLKVQVKSTHGAGDTFAGFFCSSLVLGKSIEDAASMANQKAAKFISY